MTFAVPAHGQKRPKPARDAVRRLDRALTSS